MKTGAALPKPTPKDTPMKRSRSVLNLALLVVAVAAQSCYGGYCLCLVRTW
jgi:hypothetical protein